MSVWTRLFGSTATSASNTALEALCELMKGQQKLLAQQQETLDRIVTARYDRPLERSRATAPTEPLPSWAMNDQGDSRPDPEAAEIERQLSRIATASDAEWVNGD
jgi:hypothetical protein